MAKDLEPSDVGKSPELIKRAQTEMARMDVLVCGDCHTVFHFVEEFAQHKNEPGCTMESPLRDNREIKPKVWAFLLWKMSRHNNDPSDNANSWKQYQVWVKLDDSIRDTWVVAGRTIQSYTRTGQGSLQEMAVKITKTVVDTPNNHSQNTSSTSSTGQKFATSSGSTPGAAALNRQPLQRAQTQIVDPKRQQAAAAGRTPLAKVAGGPSSSSNKNWPRNAKKSIPNSTETEMQLIEKILAKRFNPRRREHEYLIKWDKFSHEQNTWEPQSHLSTCAQMLETFEKQLAKQKQQRAEMAAKVAADAEKAKLAKEAAAKPPEPRPIRSSKARAMDQVKQWCADNEEEAKKRKHDDSADSQHMDLSADDPLPMDTSPAPAPVAVSRIAPPPAKMVRREASAGGGTTLSAAQAMIRAGQTGGGVKIVPVPKPAVSTAPATVPAAPAVTAKTAVAAVATPSKATPVAAPPVAAPPPTATAVAPKVNGVPAKVANEALIAQSVRDAKHTGIVRKPGVIITTTPKVSMAQIRILPKGDPTPTGIVRIQSLGSGGQPTTVVRRIVTSSQPQPNVSPRGATTVKSGAAPIAQTGTTIIRQTSVVQPQSQQQQQQNTIQHAQQPQQQQVARQPVANTKASIAARGQPANVRQQQLQQQQQQLQQQQHAVTASVPAGTTIVSRSQPIAQRQPQQQLQPQQRAAPSPAAGKAVISRVTKGASVRQNTQQQQQVQQQRVQQQQTTVVQTIVPPPQDDKLAALQRHGDLKVTRKNLPVNTTIKPVTKADTAAPATKAASATAYQPISGEISLCPVTGKVLAHGTGVSLEQQQQQLILQQQQEQQQQQLLQQQQLQEQQQHAAMLAELPANLGPAGEIQQLMVNEDGSPILVTGEDGTVYQVAGKNEQGQTILIAQGGDGEQQCVYVASDDAELNGLMGQATASTAAHHQLLQQQAQEQQAQHQDAATLLATIGDGVQHMDAAAVHEQQQLLVEQAQQLQQFDEHGQPLQPHIDSSDLTQQLTIATDADSQEGQITAEVVQADLPSPGGTRRVVLLLPDGSFMMTEVSDEQYQALNLVPT